MSTDPAQQTACRTCGNLLNRYVDLDTGKMRYTHPTSPTLEPADHEPDPVPADQIDAHHVCDFCSDEKIVYTFRVNPVEMVVMATNEQRELIRISTAVGRHNSICKLAAFLT